MLEGYPEILRVEDLQRILGIGRNTAYSLLKEKQIRSIRVRRLYRIPKSAVIEYLENIL